MGEESNPLLVYRRQVQSNRLPDSFDSLDTKGIEPGAGGIP